MNGAMRSASVAMTPGVTAAYNCTQFPVIADIGAGIGTRTGLYPRCFSRLKGILFDKPHLRAELRPRSRSSVFCRNMNSNVSVELDPFELMFELLPPPIVTCKRLSLHACFVLTCFTGSTSFRSKFLQCENDEKTFPADRCFCSHLEISFLPNPSADRI